ncbi:MAG: hypothetical protein Q8Q36_02865 [bacterium]|nr:hypothetical protein [bacterium]
MKLNEPLKPDLRVFLGDDNMIHLTLGGNISEEYLDDLKRWSEEVKNAMRRAKARSTDGEVLTLIDISTLDQFDQKSLAVLQELIKFNKDYATRTATFGGSVFAVLAQDAMALVSHRDNLKAFRAKEDALAWLLQKKN